MIKKIHFFLILLIFTSCSVLKQKTIQSEREFRGFWVATVVNIDWPKNGTDAVEKQKADYLEILDFYDTLNFNTAIVQIRTAGDAFYESDYAPWSKYLTGKEGEAPKTKENLLEWMIAETHQRGMEFHAWLNPYRATFDLDTIKLSEKNDFNVHPDWMLKYGKKYYYNPGLPEVREHLKAIIGEVVINYDVDAIHFDDYFYPYKIKDEVFQDSVTYAQYGLPKQSVEDWRRSNVDSLIQNTHQKIKQVKPWVQFGVSPFGVWKNKSTDHRGSNTQAGQTTYEDLYADPLLWMQKGWIDYIIPQVYWSMDYTVASHKTIVEWWAENSSNTNLYIGNGPYKIRNNSDSAWNIKKELPNQIGLGRSNTIVQGNAFFSAKSLMKNNDDVVKILKRKYYKRIALSPISPLSTGNKPSNPILESQKRNSTYTQLDFDSLEKFRYALVFKAKKQNKQEVSFKKLLTKKIPINSNELNISNIDLNKQKRIAMVFIDKFGVKTNPIFINLEQTILE